MQAEGLVSCRSRPSPLGRDALHPMEKCWSATCSGRHERGGDAAAPGRTAEAAEPPGLQGVSPDPPG